MSFNQSCTTRPSRYEYISYWKNHEEIHLILTNKSNNDSHDIDLTGIDLTTGKPQTFHDGSGWILANYNKFSVGDTIIKEKGKYTIFVKGKLKKIKIIYMYYDEHIQDTL